MLQKIIDFETLESCIKEVESVFAKNRLNMEEQDLVLRHAHTRLQTKIQQQKVNDMTNNHPLVRMAKKFLPGVGKDDE